MAHPTRTPTRRLTRAQERKRSQSIQGAVLIALTVIVSLSFLTMAWKIDASRCEQNPASLACL